MGQPAVLQRQVEGVRPVQVHVRLEAADTRLAPSATRPSGPSPAPATALPRGPCPGSRG